MIKKKKNGFTLIELLVAMSIALILMGIALVSYQGARKAARDGRRKVDLEQIRSALEMYRADLGNYPVPVGVPAYYSGIELVGTNGILYIKFPNDPLSGLQYCYRSTDGKSYSLCAALEKSGAGASGCAAGDCGDVNCNYEVTNP